MRYNEIVGWQSDIVKPGLAELATLYLFHPNIQAELYNWAKSNGCWSGSPTINTCSSIAGALLNSSDYIGQLKKLNNAAPLVSDPTPANSTTDTPYY